MKNLLPIYFLFACPLLPAQTVTVSEPLSIREDSSYDLISDGRGNVLLFRDMNTSFQVQGFDNQLHLKWEKEIELDKKHPKIVKVVPMGGDFCVLYNFRHKSDLILKAHRYNPGANLVDSIMIKNFGTAFAQPPFEVVVSEDKKVALLYTIKQQNEFTALAFHMGRMKLLWETSFSPDDLIWERDFLDITVDNDGNMYLTLEKDNRRSKQQQHYLETYDFGPATGESIRRYVTPMEGNLTFDAKISFDNLNKKLVIGGLYGSEHTFRADGYFYLQIPQAEPAGFVLRFHPFADDFVNVLLEKDNAKNKGLSEVSVQEVALRRDGGIILIGELNKRFVRGSVSGGYYSRAGYRPIIDYYYDDVFLISIHPDGTEHWKTILHKKQYSQDDDAIYSSYFLAKTPAALRILFNDEIKAENTVSEYVVRGNGEYDRNAVMNTERKELALRFRDAVQISANELIAPSEKRHRLKLVKVAY